jgi:hypothetical protein
MTRKVCVFMAVWVLTGSLAAQSQSQNEGDPLDLKSYDCATHLELVDLEDGRSDIAKVWAHGYYNGMRGVDEKTGPAGWVSVEAFSEQLLKICEEEPEKLFISVVKQIAQTKPEVSR